LAGVFLEAALGAQVIEKANQARLVGPAHGGRVAPEAGILKQRAPRDAAGHLLQEDNGLADFGEDEGGIGHGPGGPEGGALRVNWRPEGHRF
jgi:hypothetical protein